MTNFPGLFETLAADQSDARLASRKALVLSRDRIDARLGKFLGAAGNSADFAARYALVGEDFAGIVHVACDEVGHEDHWPVVKTLHSHYQKTAEEKWIQKAVKKPGDLHKKLHVPEDENIPEEKIEEAEKSGDKNLKEKAQFAENVKKSSTVSDYLSSYYASDDEDDKDDKKDDKKDGDSKPPWLKDDGDDDGNDEDDKDDHNSDEDSHKDNDHDDDDGEDDFKSSSTSGASPLVRTADEGNTEWPLPPEGDDNRRRKECPLCEGKRGNYRCTRCDGAGYLYNHKDAYPEKTQSSVRISDKGNTDLDGPSPKMKKQRWTPKSVPKDEYDGGKDGIGDHKEMDILEVQPKKNLTGPAKDVPETGKAKEEKLPTAKGMDDAGFEPSKNTGTSGPTKTFPKGNQTNPVTKKPDEE